MCGQMDLNKDDPTLRCQAKTKSPQKNTRDSDVHADDSTKRRQREAPSSPESAISEKNVQEIYPWMKEFRSKGTKFYSLHICPENASWRVKSGWGANETHFAC